MGQENEAAEGAGERKGKEGGGCEHVARDGRRGRGPGVFSKSSESPTTFHIWRLIHHVVLDSNITLASLLGCLFLSASRSASHVAIVVIPELIPFLIALEDHMQRGFSSPGRIAPTMHNDVERCCTEGLPGPALLFWRSWLEGSSEENTGSPL